MAHGTKEESEEVYLLHFYCTFTALIRKLLIINGSA